MAATELEFSYAGRQIEFIMSDQNLFRCDTKKFAKAPTALPLIHISRRDQQADIFSVQYGSGGQAKIFTVGH